MARYSDNVYNSVAGQQVALPGASIYVYARDGTLADLSEDGGGDLANPVTSDAYGGFYFNADDGLYDLVYHYGGREVWRENAVQVGEGPELPDEIVAALSQSSAASLVGYLPPGTGALTTRTVQDKLRETISVDDFGAAGDGVTDDYAVIVAAQTALVELGGGELLFTHGKIYAVGSPIPMQNGITYKGTGSSGIDQVFTTPGAKIYPIGGSAAFINAATIRHAIKFENLFFYSHSGDGGDIFDWSLVGVTAKIEFEGCTFIQENADKHIIKGTASGGVISIWIHDCDWQYQNSNSVAPFNFYSDTVNSIVIERCWSTCVYDTDLPAPTTGTYALYFESANPAGSCFNCIVRDVVFEVPIGGAVRMLAASESGVEACTIYDLFVTPTNSMFHIDIATAGYTSANCWLKGVRSQVGTTLKPDAYLNCSIAGQGAFLVENCAFSYLDGGNATPGIVIVGSNISNFQNVAYTRLSAGSGLDLHFGTTDAGSKSYTIWNGYSGNNQGYLNFYQNGAYKGAINPSGHWQWGGTIGSPNVTVTTGGGVTANSYVRVPNCTVAQLPAAGAVGSGARATVSDATATTFNSVVAGGGANIMPVFSDGADWRIG